MGKWVYSISSKVELLDPFNNITVGDFILHINNADFLDAMYNYGSQGQDILRLACSNSKLAGFISDEEASISIPLDQELNKEQFLKQQSIDPLPIFQI